MITLEEGAAHPGYTEDGHHRIHTCGEDIALGGIDDTRLAHEENQGGNTHHDDLDGGAHIQWGIIDDGTQFWTDTEDDHKKHSQQENQHSPLRTRINFLVSIVGCALVITLRDQSLTQSTLILRVFLQFHANMVLYHRSH